MQDETVDRLLSHGDWLHCGKNRRGAIRGGRNRLPRREIIFSRRDAAYFKGAVRRKRTVADSALEYHAGAVVFGGQNSRYALIDATRIDNRPANSDRRRQAEPN